MKANSTEYLYRELKTWLCGLVWLEERRGPELAEVEAEKLLLRISVVDAAERELIFADAVVKQALLGFCQDVLLNLAWYRPKVARLLLYQRILYFTVFASAVSWIAWMIHTKESTESMAILAAGFLAGLQVLVTASDRRPQLAGFHRAKAELTELLLNFEEAWISAPKSVEQGPSEDGVSVNPEFLVALKLQRQKARSIVREEQRNYFEALRGPNDVVQILGGAIGSIRQRRIEADARRRADTQSRNVDRFAATTTDLGALALRIGELESHSASLLKMIEKLSESGSASPELAQARVVLAEVEMALEDARRRHADALL